MIRTFLIIVTICFSAFSIVIVSFAEITKEFNEAGIRYLRSHANKNAVDVFEEVHRKASDNETIKNNLNATSNNLHHNIWLKM